MGGKNDNLTDKMKIFCREYIKEFDRDAAAIAAGYSAGSANVTAFRLLKKDKIQQYIRKLKASRNDRLNIDADYVLKRLHDIDNLDVLDIVTDDLSSFKPLSEWPRSWRISINAIDMKRLVSAGDGEALESIIEKVKWPDKTRNLELLGKHTAVNAFSKDDDGGNTGQPMNITFEVSEAVKEVRVTEGKPKSEA